MAVARLISTPQSRLTIRQAALSSFALVVVIVLGWFFTIRQAKGETGMAGTMGMDLGSFLLMWLPMVVAMMFPTVGPSAMAAVGGGQGGQEGMSSRPITARVAAFMAVYLAVWMVFGLAVFVALDGASELISIPQGSAKWVAAGVYGIAGLYQFTPFKEGCRRRCRVTHCCDAKESTTLARTMRAAGQHGLTCIGCCAAFMVVLITVGMTNIAAMALLTVVIFAERHVYARSATISRIAGVLLLIAAVAAPFVMWLHPGLPGPQMPTM